MLLGTSLAAATTGLALTTTTLDDSTTSVQPFGTSVYTAPTVTTDSQASIDTPTYIPTPSHLGNDTRALMVHVRLAEQSDGPNSTVSGNTTHPKSQSGEMSPGQMIGAFAGLTAACLIVVAVAPDP